MRFAELRLGGWAANQYCGETNLRDDRKRLCPNTRNHTQAKPVGRQLLLPSSEGLPKLIRRLCLVTSTSRSSTLMILKPTMTRRRSCLAKRERMQKRTDISNHNADSNFIVRLSARNCGQ